VVIVGHSIGGMTAQTLAGLRPELMGEQVKGIVLVNTTHLRPILTTAASGLVQALWPVFSVLLRLQILLSPLVHLQKWQSYMSGSIHLAARIGGFGSHVTRGQLEHTARLMTKASPAVEAKGDFAMMDWDVTRKLPDIKIPVLVLAGELDLITKPSASRTISEAIPGAQLKIMPGCGHMGFYEYSAAYNTEIAAFAEQVLSGAGAAPQRPAGAAVTTA
jgi:pimeloyl-ACP methyl ester carboxylesterase